MLTTVRVAADFGVRFGTILFGLHLCWVHHARRAFADLRHKQQKRWLQLPGDPVSEMRGRMLRKLQRAKHEHEVALGEIDREEVARALQADTFRHTDEGFVRAAVGRRDLRSIGVLALEDALWGGGQLFVLARTPWSSFQADWYAVPASGTGTGTAFSPR